MMEKSFASRPSEIIAYLGPSIGVCCYDNAERPEKLDLFKKKFGSRVLQETRLDLKLANKLQLQKVGVKNIEVSPHCTCCEKNLFPSYRREGKKRKTSIMNVIGMKSFVGSSLRT